MAETEEKPEGEAVEKKNPKYRATLYSTWKQVPAQGPVTYLIVWHVTLQAGQVIEYELLRLFQPEFSTIDPDTFSNLVEAGKLREWRES